MDGGAYPTPSQLPGAVSTHPPIRSGLGFDQFGRRAHSRPGQQLGPSGARPTHDLTTDSGWGCSWEDKGARRQPTRHAAATTQPESRAAQSTGSLALTRELSESCSIGLCPRAPETLLEFGRAGCTPPAVYALISPLHSAQSTPGLHAVHTASQLSVPLHMTGVCRRERKGPSRRSLL